jgi:hypothetical protein
MVIIFYGQYDRIQSDFAWPSNGQMHVMESIEFLNGLQSSV